MPKGFVQQITKSKIASSKPSERTPSEQLLDLSKHRLGHHTTNQQAMLGKKLSKTQPADPMQLKGDPTRSLSEQQYASGNKQKRVQSSTSQK